jgi:Domain of unknown function (DUF4209)
MSDPTLADLLVEPSTRDRADIGPLLARLAHARPSDLRMAFADAAAGAESTDPPLSRYYRLLALTFEPTLRPDNVREPFGPLMTFANGERTLVPRDFAPGHLDLLQAALDGTVHPAFNARLADILWTCKHGAKEDLLRHAATAVNSYLADARLKQHGQDWVFAPKSLERALRLSFLVDRRGRGVHQTARDATTDLAAAFEAARQWAGVSQAQRFMHEFGIGEPATHAETCEQCASAAEADGYQLLAEGLWEQAVSWWRRANDDTRSAEAIRQAAELAVRQSEARAADSAGVAASFLEQAIKQLRRLPAAERADREAELHARLAEQQVRSLEQLGQISTTFDGRETWERAEAAVTGKRLFQALTAFVLHARLLDMKKLRRQVDEDAKRFVFMHLVPIVVTGDGGKTVKSVPTMDADKATDREAAARFHMVQHANMVQDMTGRTYVEAARRVIAAEHPVSMPDLLPFMHRSGFVPSGREWQWAKAIAAGFDGDFTTATHLLVPQLEHALRTTLRGAGETAVSMDKFGQQEDWNLNHILLREGRAATEAILGEDTVFDLAALLVDRGGANLRNAVSHGLIEDGGLEGGLPRYLFWSCLRLCMIPLIAHVEGERQNRTIVVEPAAQEPSTDFHPNQRCRGEPGTEIGPTPRIDVSDPLLGRTRLPHKRA